MISCEEEGLLTQTMNVNAEPFPVKKSIRLCVANESRGLHNIEVRWQLRKNDGTVIREQSHSLSVDPLSTAWLDKVGMEDAEPYVNYISYQLLENDEIISRGTVLFCPPKHFRFLDPCLKVRLEGDERRVKILKGKPEGLSVRSVYNIR